MEYLLKSVRYNYPQLPGGILTLAATFLILAVLFGLYRQTRWGGWMSLFVALAIYSYPVIASYHR